MKLSLLAVFKQFLGNSMRVSALGVSLLVAGLLTGCAFFPPKIHAPDSVFSDKDLGNRGISKDGNAGALPNDNPGVLAAKFEQNLVMAWQALNPSSPASTTPQQAGDFISAGISLIDHRCGSYFNALGLAAQRMSFANKELNLTTGVVAALQGLTGVAAKDMALSGASLGFLGASSSAYGDVYIFSPDVASVEALVLNTQKLLKDDLKTIAVQDMTKAYAIGVLQSYEKTCEVKTIRRLVNESLVAAKPISGFDGGENAEALERFARATLAKLFSVNAISDDQLTVLYLLTFKDSGAGKVNSPYKDAIESTLKGLDIFSVALGSADVSKEPWKSIKSMLEPLVAFSSKGLDLRVASYQGAVLAKTSGTTQTQVSQQFKSAWEAVAIANRKASLAQTQSDLVTQGIEELTRNVEILQRSANPRLFDFGKSKISPEVVTATTSDVVEIAKGIAFAAKVAASAASAAASAAADAAVLVPREASASKSSLDFGPSFNVRVVPGR